MLQPDGGERVILNHHVLKQLPKKLAKKCLPYLSAQKTGLVLDKENQNDLGYLIDVPGFFSDWITKDEDSRVKIIKSLVKRLKKWNCSVLAFPLIYQYLTEEECNLIENEGIALLDGFLHRAAGLLMVVKQLLCITEKNVPQFEVGVWGADTNVGQFWVEYLAGMVNQMCIGGYNYRELEKLAEYILKSTGLSCQITTQVEVCLGNKDMTILADDLDITISERLSGLHINSLSHSKNNARSISGEALLTSYTQQCNPIEMGWINLPYELEVDQNLNPYGKLGVLDALFYSVSPIYREDILRGRITLDKMNLLLSLYELLGIRPQGFIQGAQQVHFNRFRREYFAKNGLDKSRVCIYNTFD